MMKICKRLKILYDCTNHAIDFIVLLIIEKYQRMKFFQRKETAMCENIGLVINLSWHIYIVFFVSRFIVTIKIGSS